VAVDDNKFKLNNNPAENAIRPNLIGRKNWLFSVIEAGAKANATCLSIAETLKRNCIEFFEYIKKLLTSTESRIPSNP